MNALKKKLTKTFGGEEENPIGKNRSQRTGRKAIVTFKRIQLNVLSFVELCTIPLHFALPLEVYRGSSFTFCKSLGAKVPLEPRKEAPDGNMQTAGTVNSQDVIYSETSKMTFANHASHDVVTHILTHHRFKAIYNPDFKAHLVCVGVVGLKKKKWVLHFKAIGLNRKGQTKKPSQYRKPTCHCVNQKSKKIEKVVAPKLLMFSMRFTSTFMPDVQQTVLANPCLPTALASDIELMLS